MFCIKGELDKSRQTLDGLKREQGQLNANLEKVNFWYFTITYEHWMLLFKIIVFDNINIYHHLLRLKHWKKRFVRKWNHWMSKYLEWRKDWLHTLTWKGRIINYYNLQSNIISHCSLHYYEEYRVSFGHF